MIIIDILFITIKNNIWCSIIPKDKKFRVINSKSKKYMPENQSEEVSREIWKITTKNIYPDCEIAGEIKYDYDKSEYFKMTFDDFLENLKENKALIELDCTECWFLVNQTRNAMSDIVDAIIENQSIERFNITKAQNIDTNTQQHLERLAQERRDLKILHQGVKLNERTEEIIDGLDIFTAIPPLDTDVFLDSPLPKGSVKEASIDMLLPRGNNTIFTK